MAYASSHLSDEVTGSSYFMIFQAIVGSFPGFRFYGFSWISQEKWKKVEEREKRQPEQVFLNVELSVQF